MKRVLIGVAVSVASIPIVIADLSTAPHSAPTNSFAFAGFLRGGDKLSGTLHWPDWEWAKWAGNALTLVNLGLVGYFFLESQRLRREERSIDAKRAVAFFWIQELVLKPNLSELHQFFNKYENELENLAHASAGSTTEKVRGKAEKKIREFKDGFHQIRRKILEPLTMVSSQFSPLRDIFSDLEDLVTEEFERIPGINRDAAPRGGAAVERFRALRATFFEQLHREQIALVKETK